jgi:hypothetical protein
MTNQDLEKKMEMIKDSDFDLVYPPTIQALSSRHWTPIKVLHHRRIARK